jgi:hypothetical protein
VNAKSSLSDAKSSLGDAKSSLGDVQDALIARDGKIQASHFEVLQHLGQGDVGNVQLVELRGVPGPTVQLAIKRLNKGEMINRNKVHRVKVSRLSPHPPLSTCRHAHTPPTAVLLVAILSEGSSLSPGKRLHHQSEGSSKFGIS